MSTSRLWVVIHVAVLCASGRDGAGPENGAARRDARRLFVDWWATPPAPLTVLHGTRVLETERAQRMPDTPGPDEAGQGDILPRKVKQILRDADAVIIVVNGKTLGNSAQVSVQTLVESEQILMIPLSCSVTYGFEFYTAVAHCWHLVAEIVHLFCQA